METKRTKVNNFSMMCLECDNNKSFKFMDGIYYDKILKKVKGQIFIICGDCGNHVCIIDRGNNDYGS